MNISNCNGDFEIYNWETLKKIIEESSTYPYDDIWIYDETEYPCLAILINSGFACVHYFLNDNGDMWQSVGYGNEAIKFEINGEKTDMPADAVVSLDVAIECAKQFYETHTRPICIEWREL